MSKERKGKSIACGIIFPGDLEVEVKENFVFFLLLMKVHMAFTSDVK